MQQFPKITVITPSYNQAEYLEETLLSVLNQEYPNLEYLVYDGGSTDGSKEILERYSDRLDHWESGQDEGQSHAINKGLEVASGEILTWLNSDDRLLPGALKAAAEAFSKDSELMLLYGRAELTGKRTSKLSELPKTDIEVRKIAGMIFPQPASFFHRKIVSKYGLLNRSLHFGMDYDFFLPVFLNEKTLATEQVLARYLYHDKSKSVTQNAAFAEDYMRVFTKFLRSSAEGRKVLKSLEGTGLYPEGDEIYSFELRTPGAEVLTEALRYNLLNRVIFYYAVPEIHQTLKILRFLKKTAPDFWVKHPELGLVERRCRLLPAPIIRLLRKIKNI